MADYQRARRDFFRRHLPLPHVKTRTTHAGATSRDCRRYGDRCMITRWRAGNRVLVYPEIPFWWAQGQAGEPHRMLRWALWEMV